MKQVDIESVTPDNLWGISKFFASTQSGSSSWNLSLNPAPAFFMIDLERLQMPGSTLSPGKSPISPRSDAKSEK
ncbi:MAG: hypothetical protein HC835_02075 [Oscillatoriales cyanobacterium RM2_1_1]|nr:hypothetical protein [Oscillatoriales cyanobacterium SM2_3_0]NJO44509.1 hypothetical protein [Oscillatoriales cyanobacterium RM2_1_1]